MESAGGGTWVQSSHKPWSLWIQRSNPSVLPPAGMSSLTSLQARLHCRKVPPPLILADFEERKCFISSRQRKRGVQPPLTARDGDLSISSFLLGLTAEGSHVSPAVSHNSFSDLINHVSWVNTWKSGWHCHPQSLPRKATTCCSWRGSDGCITRQSTGKLSRRVHLMLQSTTSSLISELIRFKTHCGGGTMS